MTVHGLRSSANFMFNTAKSLVCEAGASRKVGRLLLEELHVPAKSTILVVSDKGITERGLEIPCFEGLDSHGYDVVMFDDVLSDPPEANVLDAVALAKSVDAKCVIGFGGGSSMDVAKLVAFLGNPHTKQELKEVYGVGKCIGSRLPLVQIATTAGTGSEVTPISILTTGEKEKMGVVSSLLLPDIAVVDGELTLTVPKFTTAITGVDAMVHALEAYTSRVRKNPLSDLLAKEALHLLGANIRTVCREPSNITARSNMLLGSTYAGMSFANAPVGAVHALAYPIGSHFNVPHGLSNSLVLPHVLRFNEPVASDLYAELKSITFPHANEKASFAECFEELAAELEIPRSLKSVGISESDLPVLAHQAMKQTRLLPNNPRDVEEADALEMYTAALNVQD